MNTDYVIDYYPSSPAISPVFGIMYMIFWMAILILWIASMWKIFTKAGKPGWAAVIPLYNTLVLMDIIGRPYWWILLYFIPLVNIYAVIQNAIDLAKSFGKSTLFAIFGLVFFTIIGYPVLAFGKSQYVGKGSVVKSE